MYVHVHKLACHILMYEHRPFISPCVLPRACKSLFTRNGAEKRSGACTYTCMYASVELREARRRTRRTAPRQIGVVRWCARLNTDDEGKIRVRKTIRHKLASRLIAAERSRKNEINWAGISGNRKTTNIILI